MKHVASVRDSLLIADYEANAAALDYHDLFVRMLVNRRVHVWLQAQAAIS